MRQPRGEVIVHALRQPECETLRMAQGKDTSGVEQSS